MRDLKSKSRNCQAKCEEQTNKPYCETGQEVHADLACNVQNVDQNDQGNEEQDAQQDPQPQQRCRLSYEREGSERQNICNLFGPTVELHVGLFACGITRSAKQLTVQDLQVCQKRRLHFIGDRGVILGQYERIVESQRTVVVARVGNQLANIRNGCQIFAGSYNDFGNRNSFTVFSRTCNAVDRVIQGLGSIGNSYVNGICHHGELAVVYRNCLTVCILYNNSCGVPGLIVGYGYSNFRTCSRRICRNACILISDDRVRKSFILRIDFYNVVAIGRQGRRNIPSTLLAVHLRNSGQRVIAIFNRQTRDRCNGRCIAGFLIELNGILNDIPLPVEVDITGIKGTVTHPCTGICISDGSVKRADHSGVIIYERVVADVLCLEGLRGLQCAIYIVVNVVGLAGQLHSQNSVRIGHGVSAVMIVLNTALIHDLKNVIAVGLCKIQGHNSACRIILGKVILIKLGRSLYKLKGQNELVCNQELGEVHGLQGDVAILHFACHGFFTVLTHCVNADLRCGGYEGHGDCYTASKLSSFFEITVYAEAEVVSEYAGCASVKLAECSVCNAIGSCVNKLNGFVGFFTKEFQHSIVKIKERVLGIVVVDCNRQLNRVVSHGVCNQVFAVHVQHKARGKIAVDRDLVLALIVGYVIVKSCISGKGQEPVGSQVVNQSGILNKRGVCKVNLVIAVEPADRLTLIKLGYFVCLSNQILNLCKLFSIHRKISVHGQHDLTQIVALGRLEAYLNHVQIGINHHVMVGHYGDLLLILGCPAVKFITGGQILVVFKYLQVGSNGQVCVQQLYLAITRHKGDTAQTCKIQAQIDCSRPVCIRDAVHNKLCYLISGIDIQSCQYLVKHLLHKCLGVVGDATGLAKLTLAAVQIVNANVHHRVGQQLQLRGQIISYLIICILALCQLCKCFLVKLINRVVEQCFANIHTDLRCNHVGYLFKDRNVLAAVEDFFYGNVADVDAQLALHSGQQLFNSGDLLSLVNKVVGLNGQLLQNCQNITSGLVFQCLTNALQRGAVACNVLNQLVKILGGNILTGYGIQLFKAGFHQSDRLQFLIKSGRFNRIENFKKLSKGQVLADKANHIVSVKVHDIHDLLTQLGSQRIKIQNFAVEDREQLGSIQINHDLVLGNLQFIDIKVKQSLQLACGALQTAYVACQNQLKGNTLALCSLVRIHGSVNRVIHNHIRGENLALLHVCKIRQSGNESLNCRYQRIGVKLEQLGIALFGSDLLTVESNTVYILQYAVYNKSQNRLNVLLEVQHLSDLKDLVVIQLTKDRVDRNNLQHLRYRNSTQNTVKVDIVIQSFGIRICVDLVDQAGNVNLCNQRGNIYIIGNLIVAADHFHAVIQAELTNQHVKRLRHGFYVALQGCSIQAVHRCNNLVLVYNNDTVSKKRIGVKNVPSEHFTCIDLIISKQLLEVYTCIVIEINLPSLNDPLDRVEVFYLRQSLKLSVLIKNLGLERIHVEDIVLNVYTSGNELRLGSLNVDDRINVLLNISRNIGSANRDRTVIDHDDPVIIKSLNVNNVPRDQLLHSELIIVEQQLIVKASVSLYVCLPIIQGIYNSLEVVDICKRRKVGILILNLRLQSILVGDVLLKAIAKLLDLRGSCVLIQNRIHVDVARLDDLIGINQRLQLGNREVCIGQNSLFQLCNVHIVQQLAFIHVLHDQIGSDVAVLQKILCINIGLQSGDRLDQFSKLCGIHVCKQRGNIHVLRQRIKTDRLDDLVQLEHFQPLVARNDVKQILHRECLAQCCHINRDA